MTRVGACRRAGVILVGSIVGFGLLALALGGRWTALTHALAAVPLVTIAVAALLQLVSLVGRSEAWNRCVRSAGGTVSRDQLYRVASLGYLGNIVNGELGFAIRTAALRRVAPDRTPKLGALAVTEVPIVLVEAALAVLVTFTLVGPLGLPWWLPIPCFALMAALALGLRRLALRRGLAGWWRGLSVLHDRNQRTRMAGFVLLSMIAQILRNWILLRAVGVDASVFDATAVLVATAVLGLLPIGPSVGRGRVRPHPRSARGRGGRERRSAFGRNRRAGCAWLRLLGARRPSLGQPRSPQPTRVPPRAHAPRADGGRRNAHRPHDAFHRTAPPRRDRLLRRRDARAARPDPVPVPRRLHGPTGARMKNPLTSRGRHDAAADGPSAAVDDLPLPGYDRLNVGQIIARLPRLSQVELTDVESYERTHADRIDVLNKLRYLRGPEPVVGYDALKPEEIVAGLRHADPPTLKRVREYERKFHRRDVVLRALTDARHAGLSASADGAQRA